MAQVVKQGDPYPQHPWLHSVIKCEKCGCEWEIESFDDVSQNSYGTTWANCPTCRNHKMIYWVPPTRGQAAGTIALAVLAHAAAAATWIMGGRYYALAPIATMAALATWLILHLTFWADETK